MSTKLNITHFKPLLSIILRTGFSDGDFLLREHKSKTKHLCFFLFIFMLYNPDYFILPGLTWRGSGRRNQLKNGLSD